jgi:hypothetical protein
MHREEGRMAAYKERNRESLIKAAQEVLSEVGPTATIEELAAHAQVSTTTIYKYFENKDALFTVAVHNKWVEWVIWSHGMDRSSSLEEIMRSIRQMMWLNETDPFFASIVNNILGTPLFSIESVSTQDYEAFKKFASQGVVEQEDFDIRFSIFCNSVFGLMHSVYVAKNMTSQEAEKGLMMALEVFKVPKAKIKKIFDLKLMFVDHS